MRVLVTGGLGYIGSHTCVELKANGHDVVIVDNLYNSKRNVVDRIEKLTGSPVTFYEEDVCDEQAMERIFREREIDSVIHFAGYKAVGESVSHPLKYYENNLQSTISLLKTMDRHGVKSIVFSSSATVYASKNVSPLREDMPLEAINPYGQTKRMIEQILEDLAAADPQWRAVLLRYFNPIGAHASGLLGESPVGIPNNLMPYICQVADGRRDRLHIFGDDYDTPDGTGVRDYIHVVDLARGHVAALEKSAGRTGAVAYNLGTGWGTSVLELVHAFEQANQLTIPYVVEGRRPGDNATVFADCAKAKAELDWEATLSVEESCRSAWNYQMTSERGRD